MVYGRPTDYPDGFVARIWADGKATEFYTLADSLEEPKCSLTDAEYARLKEMQKKAQEAYDKAEAARQWARVNTVAYADNSVEEIWRNKDGKEKTIMITPPHGDACY